MHTIDIVELSSLEEIRNPHLIHELSSMISSQIRDATLERSTNSWVFQNGESLITASDKSTLLELVQYVRSRCLSNVFLRWTDMEHQQKALLRWSLSDKVVESYFEDDIGLVAAYRIPTWANNISNQYFIYKFFLTVLSSIRYAVEHSIWLRRRQSIVVFAPTTIDRGRAWDIALSLDGKFTPEISRDDGREDLHFGERHFSIFKENHSQTAFENKTSHNKWSVLYLPQYNTESQSKAESLGIDVPFWAMNETERFIYFMTHIVTIILLKEIWKLSHLKQEYMANI